MIDISLKNNIDKFFPEIGFDRFVERFIVPNIALDNMTLSDCKELDLRIITIANDLSLQMSIDEELANQKQHQAEKVKNEVLYFCAKNILYEYENYSNLTNGKNALTNDGYRESFAELIVQAKIKNGVLEDYTIYKHRAQILRNLWFSITEIGRRIDNWTIAESARIKRMKE